MSQLTAGVDIGTTAVKAVVVDEDGAVVGRSRLPSALRLQGDGLFEHDASATWWSAPAQVLARAGRAAQTVPGAVAVSAMAPSAAAVEPDGGPLGPGLLYGDARGRGPLPAAAGPLSSPEMANFCSWLVSQPGSEGAGGFWPAQAVANAALAGQGVVDLSTAVACGALLGGPGWDEGVCRQAGITPSQLPRIAFFGEAVGELEPPAGSQAGPGPARVVLAAGGVDGFCEQLVAGAVEDGDVLVTLGSTLVVWLTVPAGTGEVGGLWLLPHFVGGKSMLGAASNAGGLWVDWARRVLGPGERAQRGAGPADQGLTTGLSPGRVPWWRPWSRGERSPWHDPGLRVSLHDADVSHGPEALLRAGYEASAFVLRYLVERAQSCGTGPTRYLLTGGGSQDQAWVQAVADTLGVPVFPAGAPEGAARGAAFLARMALGLESSLEDARRWASWRPPVEPERLWTGPTQERFHRWAQELPG